jgi:hypothetical protein
MLLTPPSLRDWLPDNHLALFISDVVDQSHNLLKNFMACVAT